MKKAIFPGSFDPFTTGHEDIVKRGLLIFDEIIIAIGDNSQKNSQIASKERLKVIKKYYKNNNKVVVITYSCLTVDLCEKFGAYNIIRGIRNATDFDYEQQINHMNKELNDKVETIFFPVSPKFIAISSSLIREISKRNKAVSQWTLN